MEGMDVIVVGAGLAGLSCALHLRQAGHHPLVLEASDRPGGRIGSERTPDGFLIDRGFQMLLTHYPMVQALIDLRALHPCPIDAGALVRWGDRCYDLANPVTNPMSLMSSLRAPFISLQDKWVITRLTVDVTAHSSEHLLGGAPMPPTRDYLRQLGFSEAFIAAFLRPFFGSTFMNHEMLGDARLFRYYWKLIATGQAVLPADGMQAVPDQLVARLGAHPIRYGARVERLVRRSGAAQGVKLEDGDTLKADAVVIATAYPEARRLADLSLELVGNPVAGLAYAAAEPPSRARKVTLNGNPGGLVNMACTISNINPLYAPSGAHQVVVQVLGDPPEDDEALDAAVRRELAAWYPEHDVRAWRLLRLFRFPFGELRQDPATMAHLPGPRLGEQLYLASEALSHSSIDGALRGGQLAAKALLEDHAALKKVPH
jgi:phytoene dehydrogenase-like protein